MVGILSMFDVFVPTYTYVFLTICHVHELTYTYIARQPALLLRHLAFCSMLLIFLYIILLGATIGFGMSARDSSAICELNTP